MDNNQSPLDHDWLLVALWFCSPQEIVICYWGMLYKAKGLVFSCIYFPPTLHTQDHKQPAMSDTEPHVILPDTQSKSGVPSMVMMCKELAVLTSWLYHQPSWLVKKYQLKDLQKMSLYELQRLVVVHSHS